MAASKASFFHKRVLNKDWTHMDVGSIIEVVL